MTPEIARLNRAFDAARKQAADIRMAIDRARVDLPELRERREHAEKTHRARVGKLALQGRRPGAVAERRYQGERNRLDNLIRQAEAILEAGPAELASADRRVLDTEMAFAAAVVPATHARQMAELAEVKRLVAGLWEPLARFCSPQVGMDRALGRNPVLPSGVPPGFFGPIQLTAKLLDGIPTILRPPDLRMNVILREAALIIEREKTYGK